MKSGIEAVVLTGGESRRMGHDKADILIGGVPIAEKLVAALSGMGLPVTILGPKSYGGAPAISDAEPYQGPLVALSRFEPTLDFVFVAACDLIRFDAQVVTLCASVIADSQAAIPVLHPREPNNEAREPFPQPLCALYRSDAFRLIPRVLESGKRSMMALLDVLKWTPVDELAFANAQIDPDSVLGVNTEMQLREALR